MRGRVIKREELRDEPQPRGRTRAPVRSLHPPSGADDLRWEESKAIAQIGCDLAAAGRLEDARVIFEKLVEGDTNNSAALAALGTVYQKMGRADEAVAVYDAAIDVDPTNPVALGNRGELRLRGGDRQGFADLARAVECDPHGETAAGRRARALIRAITLQAVEFMKHRK